MSKLTDFQNSLTPGISKEIAYCMHPSQKFRPPLKAMISQNDTQMLQK